MNKIKRILCAALSACMIAMPIALPVSVSGAEDVSSLEQQLEDLKKQDEEYQAILDKTKADIAEKEAYKDALVKKVEVLNNKITLTHKKIDDINTDIDKKQAEVDAANQGIEDQLDALSNRLRILYMSGTATDLEIILGAKDFSDLIDKMDLVKTLSSYDKELIDEIKVELEKISKQKKALELDKTKLVEQQESLKADQQELSDLISENDDILRGLYSSSDDAQAALEQAAADREEIQKKIQAYYDEQYKNAHQTNNSNNNNSNSNTNNNTVNNGGSSAGGNGYVPSPTPAASGYTWPVPGYYWLSSQFYEARTGYYHGGIDIAGAGIMGATVVAASDGYVFSSNNSCPHNWAKEGSCGCGSGFGNYVMIDHGGGKTAIYGHLTSAVVSTGQYVTKGQVVGYVGSTGYSTGPHLHFECHLNGVKYDPMSEY